MFRRERENNTAASTAAGALEAVWCLLLLRMMMAVVPGWLAAWLASSLTYPDERQVHEKATAEAATPAEILSH